MSEFREVQAEGTIEVIPNAETFGPTAKLLWTLGLERACHVEQISDFSRQKSFPQP